MAETSQGIEIVATPDQIETVVRLAHQIWTEHYTPIIGEAQVAYMLDTFHSGEIIARQIADEGFRYVLLQDEGRDVGYLGFRVQEEDVFLSKLYVLSSERGKGIGKRALAYLRAETEAAGRDCISLTVNKGNTGTIAAYERIGFHKTGDVVADIGSGYVMDDYQMAWRL